MRKLHEIYRKITKREGGYMWIGACLTPLSILYGLSVTLKRQWYESENRRVRLPVPVISVGNIEVGGTGKTPVTIWLANRIHGMGYKVLVVARNFGAGKTPGRVRPDTMDTRKNYTDEVLLLAESLRGKCTVYAGKSKTETAIKGLRAERPDVILIDDGFQHFRLHRDLDLVILDFKSPFGNGELLPAGTLREYPSAVSRADYIWINRVSTGMSAEWTKRKLLDYNWKAPMLFSRIEHTGLKYVGGGSHNGMPGGMLYAFCGIGKPESFRNSLEEAGILLAGMEIFPDHYEYSPGDLVHLRNQVRVTRASGLITTEKDAVKLRGIPGTGDVLVQTVNLEVTGSVAELMKHVQELVEGEGKRDDID